MTKPSDLEDGRDNVPVWIHAEIDDYGLDPYEFRLYARLARRAGRGEAWESVSNMGKSCKMGDRKAKDALNLLFASGLVEREQRKGQTTIYRLTPRSKWVAPEKLEELRQQVVLSYKHSTEPRCQEPRCQEPRCQEPTEPRCQEPTEPRCQEPTKLLHIEVTPSRSEESLSPTSLTPKPKMGREREKKIEIEKEELEGISDYAFDLAKSVYPKKPLERAEFLRELKYLPDAEIEAVMSHGLKKASDLPKPPTCPDEWVATRFTKLRIAFLDSPDGRQAKQEAIAAKYDFSNFPHSEQWLKDSFPNPQVWIQAVEAEREIRRAFWLHAKEKGLYEPLIAALEAELDAELEAS